MEQIAFAALVGALIGALCGQARGRVGAGVIFGLLLGPIGWLLVLVGKDYRPKCPHCGGVIETGKRVCKHCGRDLQENP